MPVSSTATTASTLGRPPPPLPHTTYKRFFGLVKQVEHDREVPKKAAAKALGQFLELYPVNIEQVVQVIIEHFRLKVMHELGGRAKAMKQ